MQDIAITKASSARRRRAEGRQFHLVLWVSFALFLVVVAASRLLPASMRGPQVPGPRPSVFREAWLATTSCIPFAYR
jgi:hypothetical protein